MTAAATYFSDLSATVAVDGLPAARRVVAVECSPDGGWRVCGSGLSDHLGVAEIAVGVVSQASRVYAVAVDDWGDSWAPSKAVSVGAVIRPTVFEGWVYRVTSSGTLGSTEPAWWGASKTGPQPVGTAMLEAFRYYQPLAHGPVPLQYASESDPYWGNVVSLLNFEAADGSTTFVDDKGKAWNVSGSPVLRKGHAPYGASSGFFRQAYIESAASSDWAFGTGDFTVEAVISPLLLESALYDSPIGNWASNVGWCFFIEPSGRLDFVLNNSWVASPAGVLKRAKWNYIGVRRRSGVVSLSVDGEIVGTANVAADVTSTAGVRIGCNRVSGDNFEGFIKAARVTKGVGRDFVMPTRLFPSSG